MKKAKLIYNPFSGDTTFKDNLDLVIEALQGDNNNGYEVHAFRTINYGDIDIHFKSMEKDYYDVIIACGGDGTVNLVINAMLKYGIDANLGIIPSGTANDFATFLNIPKEPKEAAEIIAEGNKIPIDIGFTEGKYFVNVMAIGSFASVSQSVDKTLKHSIGKLAYYAKGIENLPNFKPVKLRITNSNSVIEGNFYLATILNSSSAGGFDKLAPYADVSDGCFDFVGFCGDRVVEVAKPFINVLRGEHIHAEKNVVYFKDDYIKIEAIDEEEKNKLAETTDVDGEVGPKLPVEVTVVKNKINLFVPVQI